MNKQRQLLKSGYCKCIQTDPFYQGMLIQLELNETYQYEIYLEIEDQGEGNWAEKYYYSIFTQKDRLFIIGGLETNFNQRFMDLTDWRTNQLNQLGV